MSFTKGSQVSNRRKEWIQGVAEMLSKLTMYPDLPVPKMSADSTFVAMVYEKYEPGELLAKLVHATNELHGATLEFYNWTEDRLPEMDRLRLVWMFGPIRYEVDAGMADVFGAGSTNCHRAFTNVNYIGENINTMVRPDASESS